MSNPTKTRPSVACIVLNWNGRALLEPCLSALASTDYPAFSIIVVDNGSDDESVPFVRSNYPNSILIENEENLGFTGGMNIGFEYAMAEGFDYLISVNNDVVVRPSWLAHLIDAMEADPQIGVAGCKLLYPDEVTLQHAGGTILAPRGINSHYFEKELDQGQADQQKEVDYVTGALFAIRRACVERIGLLDPLFRPLYFEETDYCYRARTAGWKVTYVPSAVAIHHESKSVNTLGGAQLAFFERNRILFVLRHFASPQEQARFEEAEAAFLRDDATLEQLSILEMVYADEAELRASHEPSRSQMLGRLHTVAHRMKRQKFPKRLKQPVVPDARFRSESSLFGPLLIWIRTQWNNIAGRWYVRMMVDDLNEKLTAQDRLLHDRIRGLTHEVEQLKKELNRDKHRPKGEL